MGSQVSAYIFRSFLKWFSIVTLVVLLFYVGVIVVVNLFVNVPGTSVFSGFYDTHSIFMLVIGIVAVYPFLYRLVFFGVSRQNYFKGTLSAGIKISIVSLVVALAIALLEYGIIQFFNTPFDPDYQFSKLGDNILIASIAYLLSVFNTFLIGWMIALSFYKHRGLGGTIAIIISVFLFGFLEYFWEITAGDITINGIEITYGQPDFIVSFIATLAMLFGLIWVIRRFSQDVTIRL